MHLKDYGWTEIKTDAHDYLIPAIREALNLFNVEKNALILDAGCGSGYVLGELYKSNYKNIFGFDLSESGINLAKKTYSNIAKRFFRHDCYEKKLPTEMPEKNYDIILSIEVIEHLYSLDVYLSNINYWLKYGGLVILTTPYHGWLKNLAIAVTNKFDKHFDPLWEGGHIKFFSKKTIFEILKRNRFKPLMFKGIGRLPYLWKSMLIVAEKEKRTTFQ